MDDITEAPKKNYAERNGSPMPKGLDVLNKKAAGIDIGSRVHYVCAPNAEHELEVGHFGCFTDDLRTMAQWLKARGVETVVMESTGSYWIPVYRFLEESGLEVHLVDARHVKYVPGRKTDVLDCQWLQKLHSYGLLSSAFVPDREIIALRQLWRWRKTLVETGSQQIQHMQRALTEMNLHLAVVLSDISGVSAMAIMRAIVAGQRDPQALARLSHPLVKRSPEDIAKALDGHYRAEQLFILRQAIETYDHCHQQIEACDRNIEHEMQRFERQCDSAKFRSTKKNKRNPQKPRKNEPHFDMAAELYSLLGVNLTSIDGIDAMTAFTIVSEIGFDVRRFPNIKCFTNWLGLCPNNEITGGRVKRRRTKKTQNRAAQALRVAAQSLHHSKTYLGAYFRRMKTRLGPAKATTAAAHKLARIVYNLLKHGQDYVDKGEQYEEKQHHDRKLRHLEKLARDMGYELLVTTTGELLMG